MDTQINNFGNNGPIRQRKTQETQASAAPTEYWRAEITSRWQLCAHSSRRRKWAPDGALRAKEQGPQRPRDGRQPMPPKTKTGPQMPENRPTLSRAPNCTEEATLDHNLQRSGPTSTAKHQAMHPGTKSTYIPGEGQGHPPQPCPTGAKGHPGWAIHKHTYTYTDTHRPLTHTHKDTRTHNHHYQPPCEQMWPRTNRAVLKNKNGRIKYWLSSLLESCNLCFWLIYCISMYARTCFNKSLVEKCKHKKKPILAVNLILHWEDGWYRMMARRFISLWSRLLLIFSNIRKLVPLEYEPRAQKTEESHNIWYQLKMADGWWELL